jgi:hypothetical protein
MSDYRVQIAKKPLITRNGMASRELRHWRQSSSGEENAAGL